MQDSLEIIIDYLTKSGLTLAESENLLALFLEENAEEYVSSKELIK